MIYIHRKQYTNFNEYPVKLTLIREKLNKFKAKPHCNMLFTTKYTATTFFIKLQTASEAFMN